MASEGKRSPQRPPFPWLSKRSLQRPHSASAHHSAHIPQALTTTPTIPLVEQVSTRVGPRPTERTWKEEWRAMYSEDRVTHGKPPLSDASVVPGAECSIEVKSKDKKGEIDWRSLMASDDL